MVGVKYSTFATWRQDRRRAARARCTRAATPAPATAPASSSSAAGAMRWLEAVVAAPSPGVVTGAPAALRLSLPGGVALEIREAGQAPLLAALLRALVENRGQ